MLIESAPQTLAEAWRACERGGREADAAERRRMRAGGRKRGSDGRAGERVKATLLCRAGFFDELGYPTALTALYRQDPHAAFSLDPAERALVAELRQPLRDVARLSAGLIDFPAATRRERLLKAELEQELAGHMAVVQRRAVDAGAEVNRLLALIETEGKLEALARHPQRKAA